MTSRLNISGRGPWEERVGYSRAVRAGNVVYVSGTTAAELDGTISGGDDGYLQTMRCFRAIDEALAQAGASLAGVVRTRMFVTDIDRWEEFARAHAEVFGDIRPAATMVEVRRLIAPGMLIEIEAEAVVGDGTG